MTTQAFSADSAKDYLGTELDALTSTMTVLMKTNKYYTDNSLKQTGQSYTVTREWGKIAVEQGWASDTGAVLPVVPTPAGLTAAEVVATKPLVSDDGIAPPTSNVIAAVGAAGVLTGAYYYSTTYVTALGETAPWPGTATVVNPSSQQVNLTAIPVGPAGVIARRIYRTPAVSGVVDPKDYRYVAEVNDNTTTTYTDNTADGSLGAAVDWTASNRGQFKDATQVRFAAFSDQSTALGKGTFSTNTGYASTAVGFEALKINTTGRRNTALGVYSLTSLTTGYENTAVGVHSGQYLATGAANVFVGYTAGFNSTGTANYNVGVGVGALAATAGVGSGNVALGYRSLYSINTADQCIGIGYFAGRAAGASRQLFIDNVDRGVTLAAAQDSGLIYGKGESTAQTQVLHFNAATRVGWGSATVAQLPAAAAGLKGFRAWVGDATVAYTSANVGSTVAGGGANTVPVFCNGTNWVVG